MKRLLLFACVASALVWLFFPAADVVSPDWNVIVTDAEGRPIEAASITVFFQQYTLERVDHEETKTTGADGRVHFNERRIRAMNVKRLIGVTRNLDQGAHASFGVHTYLHADAKGYGDPSSLELFGQNERECRANGRARQSSHITLMRCPRGYSGFGCSFPDDPSQPVLPLRP